jgi:transcriptional regulator with XRE-family HTH domain
VTIRTYKTLREYVDAHPRTVTQGTIAKRLGLSQTTLSGYLTGRILPRRDVALRLSRKFHISLEGLLDPPEAKAS